MMASPLLALLGLSSLQLASTLNPYGNYVVADMHDGDQKSLVFPGLGEVDIAPYNNTQKWKVVTHIEKDHPDMMVVDFNVANKPNPPPVNLTATRFLASRIYDPPHGQYKNYLVFSDPSGTIAAAGSPVNSWVQVADLSAAASSPAKQPVVEALSNTGEALSSSSYVVYDMHDGDQKQIETFTDTSGSPASIKITPHGNNQTWVVTAALSGNSRGERTYEAVVNFNVPNKPSPPPVNLTMKFWYLDCGLSPGRKAWEFTDPTGTIAEPGYPVNAWVQWPYKGC